LPPKPPELAELFTVDIFIHTFLGRPFGVLLLISGRADRETHRVAVRWSIV
jgi:hypothetical protein